MIDVHSPETSHALALQWRLDDGPAQKYITRLQELLAEVDGRSVQTLQARWARGLLKVELAAAKKHLATITKAAADVEPSRKALAQALALVEQCRAAAATAATGEALVVARAEFELKSRALVALRAAFNQAVAAVHSHPSECTIGEVQRVYRADDWGTFYLIKIANAVNRYQPGHGNTAHDAAKKMGCEATVCEMVVWVTQETDYLDDPAIARCCAIRFEWFAKKNGIAIETVAA